MNEVLVGLRRAALAFYRRLPGRPFAGPLVAVDRMFKRRFAGRRLTAERGGFDWELDLDQHIDRHIYLDGLFEQPTSTALDRLVKPGMTVLDIGANIGAHCLPLSARVGSTGRVFAFEPTAWAYEKLRRNLALNPTITNVVAERVALSDVDEAQGDYAFQSQYSAEGGGTAEQGSVPFVRLDTFCSRHGVERVGVVKLDVDGFETKILRGAVEMLRRDRPALVVEVSDYWQRRAGDSFAALEALLEGYDPFELDTTTKILDLPERIAGLADRDAINIVCLPRRG